jgi:hypothetical protein
MMLKKLSQKNKRLLKIRKNNNSDPMTTSKYSNVVQIYYPICLYYTFRV